MGILTTSFAEVGGVRSFFFDNLSDDIFAATKELKEKLHGSKQFFLVSPKPSTIVELLTNYCRQN